MRPSLRFASALLALAVSGAASAQCVSLTTSGAANTQNFDTLSNTAGSTTNNLTITGWFMTETGGGARDNEQYAVDTGGSNTGDTFSYGAAAATDRALGGLQSGTLIPVIGACFTNNTGGALSSVDIAYTGEQWRIANTAAARDDRLDFQYSVNATSLITGTWTDVDTLDFTNPIKTNATATALVGNLSANRTAISSTISSLSIANGATFWIRWNDLNASGADDALAVDDFSLTPNGSGPSTPSLSINDIATSEGNAGTTNISFTLTLSQPAGPGGVTYDIATADGTAQDDNPVTEDNDYVPQSLTGQTISEGVSVVYFQVTINGDTTTEANETFFANITNVTGATVADGQGQATINNDDITVTRIHDVQGPGASSPIVGSSVHVRGIVTARTGSGFFVQEENGDVDADPNTSEGIFVYTNSAPPATATVGNDVTVNGTVAEFVPSDAPWTPPVTELVSPSVTQNSTGNGLPTAIDLNTALQFVGAYSINTFEPYEGMRVSVSDLDVVAASDGSINESSGVVTSDHTFFGVLGGLARPYREPGLPVTEAPFYPGYTGPIFDQNMERIRVRGRGQAGATHVLDVAVGDGVTGLVGVMDVFAGNYTILPDVSSTPIVVPGSDISFARLPTSGEFTVAGANLLRFYDDINDIGGPNNGDFGTVSAATYNNRLEKAARVVCQAMNAPDIIGVVEVEKKAVLDALAAKIDVIANSGCATAPHYVAYLTEGNDVGGIDVGFLVKTAEVSAGVPRVTVNSVTQQGLCTLFKDASGNNVLSPVPANNNGCAQQGVFLNDRPPLFLDATVHAAGGGSEDITVVSNHLRSLNDANGLAGGSNGYTTDGARVRAKRHQQAVELANMIQQRQVNDPGERIILVGDFNVFEFNDGLGDSMGTIMGTPAADSATVVPGDGADLVEPNLTNLTYLNPAAERYSYSFDGNAQSLDHALANQATLNDFTVEEGHPRINADFPVKDYDDFSAGSIARISDHDPVIVYLGAASFSSADLYTQTNVVASPINLGQQAQFTVVAGNYGQDDATGVKLDFSIAVAPARVSVVVAPGWTCGSALSDGSGGTIVHCNRALMSVEAASFQVNVNTSTGDSFSSLTLGAAITGANTDPNHTNDSSSDTVLFNVTTDLQLAIAPPTGRLSATVPVAFKATIVNAGASSASGPYFDFTLNAPSSAVTSISSQYGYFTGCTAQTSSPTSSTWHCPGSTLPRAKKDVVSINVVMPAGWTNTAMTINGTVGSSTMDSKPSNNSASASAPVPRR